jgi:hypothetical protein
MVAVTADPSSVRSFFGLLVDWSAGRNERGHQKLDDLITSRCQPKLTLTYDMTAARSRLTNSVIFAVICIAVSSCGRGRIEYSPQYCEEVTIERFETIYIYRRHSTMHVTGEPTLNYSIYSLRDIIKEPPELGIILNGGFSRASGRGGYQSSFNYELGFEIDVPTQLHPGGGGGGQCITILQFGENYITYKLSRNPIPPFWESFSCKKTCP